MWKTFDIDGFGVWLVCYLAMMVGFSLVIAVICWL
jgi:hypothetical protein